MNLAIAVSHSLEAVRRSVMLLVVAAAPAVHEPVMDELVNRPSVPPVCYTVWNECDVRT